MKLAKEVDSLSNFKRKTPDFLARMKQTGQPIVLTINGKAEVVVQDAASYRRLLSASEESLEFLQRSLKAADAGQTRPLRKGIQSLGRNKR